jgi:hypothetical protein
VVFGWTMGAVVAVHLFIIGWNNKIYWVRERERKVDGMLQGRVCELVKKDKKMLDLGDVFLGVINKNLDE